MVEFKMPDIGEGVAEGEVVKWHVKEGDTVTEDQPLVEASTDKATVVIPCPTSGVVQKIYVSEGSTAKVGQVLVTFSDKAGKPAAEAPKSPQPAAREERAPAREERPQAREERPQAREERPRAEARMPENGKSAAPPAPSQPGGKVLAAPATRKMAREAGVDLSRVPGSGPAGRVTREDLVAYLERGQSRGTTEVATRSAEAETREEARPQEPSTPQPPARTAPKRPVFAEGARPEERVPVRGVRKKIAENMRRSKDHAAHFTFVEECDMTELVKLREEFDDLAKKRDIKLTYLAFIVKAVVAGLKDYPYINGTYDEEAQEIVVKGYYNIGIAVATDEGLVVPVVKDCDRKSILEIAAEIQRLGDAARNRQLKLDELQGGTFTITSLGAQGGIMATPVINYPELAILGVHKIRKRPVVKNDEIVVRDMCYLTCSFDHRIIDGHIGAQFVIGMIKLLEDPRLLLLGA